jgi:hypothetical protein
MKKVLAGIVVIAAVAVVAHAALAFMGPGHRPGMGYPMMQMAPPMMAQGTGGPIGPGMHRGAMNATQVSADEARAIAQKYVDEQLAGYTIENVVPSTGMPRTMYTVELNGPKGERKALHVSPFGQCRAVPRPAAAGVGVSLAGLPRHVLRSAVSEPTPFDVARRSRHPPVVAQGLYSHSEAQPPRGPDEPFMNATRNTLNSQPKRAKELGSQDADRTANDGDAMQNPEEIGERTSERQL